MAGKRLSFDICSRMFGKKVYSTGLHLKQINRMPEGPRTIHIFMNFLQCYSLWRTVFEPNHCEYRVDLLNWHEHSCPTFKNAGAKIVLHPLNTMIEYKRFWGDGQSVCHPGWPVYRPGYQGLLFEKSAHGGNFFRLLATARLTTQRYWEVFDIPIAEMDEPIWQTKTSATIVRLVQTGEMHQLSIFDHYVGEIDAPYYS